MELTGIFILIILFTMMILLVVRNTPADLVFGGGLIVMILFNLVSTEHALAGFSNEGLLTIAALYVVAYAMKETGAIQLLLQTIIGHTHSIFKAQARIIGPVLGLSAFLNNTPIVASFIPAIKDWSKQNSIPSSKLLIPLSYAAILGGTCTLIGTSTNLIINGMLIDARNVSMNLFDPAWVGIPLALVGITYLLLFSRKLLPDRTSGFQSLENTREYTIEMVVPTNSPLSGKTIEEAGLRHLDGLYLVEIIRGDRIIAAVEPSEILQPNDRLLFTGVVDAVGELQRLTGLQPATDQIFKLDTPRNERHLVEAVVAPSNPLNGLTIREGQFRNRFGAVILAVSRDGKRIKSKVGDIRLRTGDILLMETPRNFSDRFRSSSEFLLVSTLSKNGFSNSEKTKVAWVILAGMVGLVSLGVLTMFKAAFLAAGMMVLTRCCRFSEARRAIDWQVLIVIGSALGIANTLISSGLANQFANHFMNMAGSNPMIALIITYFLTWILTEIITNNATAALVFPIAMTMAESLDVHYMPFVMVIIFAASASFSTPIGYQTNLMVMGPGGYKYTDFLRIGLPLNLLTAIIVLTLVPIVWPF